MLPLKQIREPVTQRLEAGAGVVAGQERAHGGVQGGGQSLGAAPRRAAGERRGVERRPDAQGDGAAPLRLTPDSGAHSLVFFEHGEGSTPAMTPVDAGGLRTLSGIRVARRVLVDALDVGGIRLRNQMALVVRRSWPTGEDAGRLGDGLLPLHLFEEVTINVASGYLVVRGQRRQAQSASLR